MNKLLMKIAKYSGCLMAFALVVAEFSKYSTCPAIFHQPKVPQSLLEKDND